MCLRSTHILGAAAPNRKHCRSAPQARRPQAHALMHCRHCLPHLQQLGRVLLQQVPKHRHLIPKLGGCG